MTLECICMRNKTLSLIFCTNFSSYLLPTDVIDLTVFIIFVLSILQALTLLNQNNQLISIHDKIIWNCTRSLQLIHKQTFICTNIWITKVLLLVSATFWPYYSMTIHGVHKECWHIFFSTSLKLEEIPLSQDVCMKNFQRRIILYYNNLTHCWYNTTASVV